MKIYTRTGDKGTTSLVGGKRVAKNDVRLEAYGTVDELNSWLGMVAASGAGTLPAEDAQFLVWLQNKLFDLGCELATEPESEYKPRQISDADVSRLEAAIDRVDATLPVHNRFILPGGTRASAQAQVARTVARRAERRMLDIEAPEQAMAFINRLSDYLFILARQLNVRAGVPEVFWDQTL